MFRNQFFSIPAHSIFPLFDFSFSRFSFDLNFKLVVGGGNLQKKAFVQYKFRKETILSESDTQKEKGSLWFE